MNTILASPLRYTVYRLAMLQFAGLICALCITLGGCAATPAGIRGHDAFIAESVPRSLSGPIAATDAARCFEDSARFLPLSEFSRVAGGPFTYRLRVADLWFEQVVVVDEGPGSRAEVRVAPNLDGKWSMQFERDRVAPLRRCVGDEESTNRRSHR